MEPETLSIPNGRARTSRGRRILSYLLISLLCALPATASIQCGLSDEDPSIRIEPVDVDKLPAAKEGRPAAGFRITGIRPKRILRIGFHSWRDQRETPKPYRDGYMSLCEPFEHFVIVWVREDASANPGDLLIHYQYVFDEGAPTDGAVVTLKIPRSAFPYFQSLSGPTTVPLETDLPVWGVFLGAIPNAGESITDVAARSDRALVLHVRNSTY